MKLKGQVGLVTGAASGIGFAIATRLLREGINIAVVDVDEKVKEWGSAVPAFVGDVTDAKFRRHVFDEVEQRLGPIKLLVPAAGITRDSLAVRVDKKRGEVQLYPEELFTQVLNVNLLAPTYWAIELVGRIAQERLRHGFGKWHGSVEEEQGVIVFIGSVSSDGNIGQVSYSAAKAGLRAVVETLNMEWAFHGVRCGLVHPGFTDTPMVGKMPPEKLLAVINRTKIGRLISPDEIAESVLFLIRNQAAQRELWMDGGVRLAA